MSWGDLKDPWAGAKTRWIIGPEVFADPKPEREVLVPFRQNPMGKTLYQSENLEEEPFMFRLR